MSKCPMCNKNGVVRSGESKNGEYIVTEFCSYCSYEAEVSRVPLEQQFGAEFVAKRRKGAK